MTTTPSSLDLHNTPNQTYEVMPLELFFDLVFVFAVSQLSHHLLEHLAVAVRLLLFGGPVLCLLAEGWYPWAVPHVWPRVRMIGSAALVLVGFATWPASAYIPLMLAGVTLATLAILDQSKCWIASLQPRDQSVQPSPATVGSMLIWANPHQENEAE